MIKHQEVSIIFDKDEDDKHSMGIWVVSCVHCFIENKLNTILWYLLVLAKYCRNKVLKSLKDCMEFDSNLLNHHCAKPTRVVKNSQHLTPSEYWCKSVTFSKWPKCSSGSIDLVYSTNWRGLKCLGNSSDIISWIKGVFRWEVDPRWCTTSFSLKVHDTRTRDSLDCSYLPCIPKGGGGGLGIGFCP